MDSRVLLAIEWVLYIVMILSFLHMAEIAWDAKIQYQRMTAVAEEYNTSVVILADLANLSVHGSGFDARLDAIRAGRLTVTDQYPCTRNITCGSD